MRLKTIALACAAMLSLLTAPALTACASLPSFETSPLESTLVDDKALYAAEAAYFGAAPAVASSSTRPSSQTTRSPRWAPT